MSEAPPMPIATKRLLHWLPLLRWVATSWGVQNQDPQEEHGCEQSKCARLPLRVGLGRARFAARDG